MSSLSSRVGLPRVLVVEDEALLRSSMMQGLARHGTLEVVGAATVTEALQTLATRAPSLIIAETDLPDRPGVELLAELRSRGLEPRVVFVSGHARRWRDEVPAHLELLEKPITLARLRELAAQVVPRTAAPFGVADYLQLASMGHHSVVLDVDGPISGEIVIVEGEAWSAEDDLGAGVSAFRRLVATPGAQVTCRMLSDEPRERTLNGSCESLLLDCLRLQDEAKHGAAPEPKDAEPDFDELFDAGVEASLSKQYSLALDLFRLAGQLHPDDPRVKVNVTRLEQLTAAA
ncbi:MAG: response regulator [Myxococcota bacterium]